MSQYDGAYMCYATSKQWGSIHERVKQHWGWVEEKHCLQEKACSSDVYSCDSAENIVYKNVAWIYPRYISALGRI